MEQAIGSGCMKQRSENTTLKWKFCIAEFSVFLLMKCNIDM